MAEVGYGITLTGKYYFEVKFTDRRLLRSFQHESLESLLKVLPVLYDIASDTNNIKKHKARGKERLCIYNSKNKIVAFTTTIPNDKIHNEFMADINSFFKNGSKDAPKKLNCFIDDSKKVVQINSVTEFLSEIEKINLKSGNIFYFRGHSSYLYEMQPSIYRKRELINNEDVIHKELLIRCPTDFEKLSTTFEILVKMQHYSLPTRLLDLTSNPLIALYFACENFVTDKNVGEVKILSIPKNEIKYYDSDTVTVLSNLSKQSKEFSKECIKNKNLPAFTRLMDDIKKEKSYFEDKMSLDSIDCVVCVKPKLNNARIIKQDGAFLLFGMSNDKHTPSKIPTKYLPSGTEKRVFIANEFKGKIIEQLEKIGISAATIYPEIDKVSNYISIKYGKPEEIEEERGMLANQEP
ncbi:FRG domain [Buttiauxella agrestis]|uniref:FRG domain n=1 Tax=Buttiauxella agrestis TaxID=82977 RepID=A0A381C6Q8_9ENTR|nr:FRG domain-containing protein [Buttiauxella agrestis]SUW63502.1 FRG domain [Buttiauxella agrestis]